MEKKHFLFHNKEMKFSIFSRYERLNTHQGIHQDLINLPMIQSNLNIWTFGFNFNSRENIVWKANHQYRKNKVIADPFPNKHIVEMGMGFIF